MEFDSCGKVLQFEPRFLKWSIKTLWGGMMLSFPKVIFYGQRQKKSYTYPSGKLT